eukprot:scaffold31189_cov72-Cyclotella_meneghiniana.AAC.2
MTGDAEGTLNGVLPGSTAIWRQLLHKANLWPLLATRAISTVFIQAMLYIAVLFGLSISNWTSSCLHHSVWLVFYFIPWVLVTVWATGKRTVLFIGFDLPNWCKEWWATDSTSELSRDIDHLLSEPEVTEWTIEDTSESTMVSDLTSPSKRLPPASNIVYEATHSSPNFSIPAPLKSYFQHHPQVGEQGENIIDDRKRLSKACRASPPSSTPVGEPPSDPTMDFLSTFNPASAGLQLLVVERPDRLNHHVMSPERYGKHVASVNVRKARDDILASAIQWSFPATDETVFNSLGTGIEAPLIVDSGASCCITPHRDDFVSYGASKVKVKDLSGVNKVAGEGLISWTVVDRFGAQHELQLKAYHISRLRRCIYSVLGPFSIPSKEVTAIKMLASTPSTSPENQATSY